jgi:hypothetical protein
MLPKVAAFVQEVGPEIVMGLYRATPHAPAQAFWSHREHVHTAAAIAMADSVLSDHRGFPVLLEVADRMASAAFGGARLRATVQAAYARTDKPFSYLGERDTRR